MQLRHLLILVLVMPQFAAAATLYFDPQERTVGPDVPFDVAVLLDAPRPVNAFDVTVKLPPGIESVSFSDGGSAINYWIQRPTFDEKRHSISFAGIVPGGFTGTAARLVTMTLRAHVTGETLIGFDEQDTDVRQNTPDAAPESLVFSTVSLSVQTGRENLGNFVPDRDAPMPFSPSVVTDPSVGGGLPVVVFATQDTGTGVVQYYVSEQSTPDPRRAVWQEAVSPYVLSDPTFSSWILVKAVDGAGNERIETLPPHSENRAVSVLHAIVSLFVLACFILIAYVRIRPRLR
jgi:hypothetical protein